LLAMLIKFALVGVSGVVVNLAVYSFLILLGNHYLIAAVLSFICAVTNNFFWNFLWTFKGRAVNISVERKYLSFFLISLLNFGLNICLLQELVTALGMNKIIAQLIAIGIVSCLNFLGNYKITFKEKKPQQKEQTDENSYHYSHLQ